MIPKILTPDDQEFIRKHHRKLDITKMANALGTSWWVVNKFMTIENLEPMYKPKTRQAIQREKFGNSKMFNVDERETWLI